MEATIVYEKKLEERLLLLLFNKYSMIIRLHPIHDSWEMQVKGLCFWNCILVMKWCFLILHPWKTKRFGTWFYSGLNDLNRATKNHLEANIEIQSHFLNWHHFLHYPRDSQIHRKPKTAVNETVRWNFTCPSVCIILHVKTTVHFPGIFVYFCCTFFETQRDNRGFACFGFFFFFLLLGIFKGILKLILSSTCLPLDA